MPFIPSSALLDKFRASAAERLDRVLAQLQALGGAHGQGRGDATASEAYTLVERELHTLKGDAGMLGFRGVAAVAQALEQLLISQPLQPGDFFQSEFNRGAAIIRSLLPNAPEPPDAQVILFVKDVTEAMTGLDLDAMQHQ